MKWRLLNYSELVKIFNSTTAYYMRIRAKFFAKMVFPQHYDEKDFRRMGNARLRNFKYYFDKCKEILKKDQISRSASAIYGQLRRKAAERFPDEFVETPIVPLVKARRTARRRSRGANSYKEAKATYRKMVEKCHSNKEANLKKLFSFVNYVAMSYFGEFDRADFPWPQSLLFADNVTKYTYADCVISYYAAQSSSYRQNARGRAKEKFPDQYDEEDFERIYSW